MNSIYYVILNITKEKSETDENVFPASGQTHLESLAETTVRVIVVSSQQQGLA